MKVRADVILGGDSIKNTFFFFPPKLGLRTEIEEWWVGGDQTSA